MGPAAGVPHRSNSEFTHLLSRNSYRKPLKILSEFNSNIRYLLALLLVAWGMDFTRRCNRCIFGYIHMWIHSLTKQIKTGCEVVVFLCLSCHDCTSMPPPPQKKTGNQGRHRCRWLLLLEMHTNTLLVISSFI